MCFYVFCVILVEISLFPLNLFFSYNQLNWSFNVLMFFLYFNELVDICHRPIKFYSFHHFLEFMNSSIPKSDLKSGA